jgi:hypothetical protein
LFADNSIYCLFDLLMFFASNISTFFHIFHVPDFLIQVLN